MALKYTITLPPPGAGDVASRELSVTIGDAPTAVLTLPGAALAYDNLLAQHGQAVAVSLVDIDGVGNRSSPSDTLVFTATDNIPPPQPGQLSVAGVVQVEDAPPTP